MSKIIYDAIVVGGGATGTAVFRDLALRGFKVGLIERGDLGSGCTGNSHGNLVGGLRYVVKDPSVARECASENRILREIAPHLISGQDNYWLGRDDNYIRKALAAAKELDVVAELLNLEEVYREIPELALGFQVAVRSADINIDTTGMCRACLNQGLEKLSKNHFGLKGYYPNDTIATLDRREGGEFVVRTQRNWAFSTRTIVNATGAWANSVLELLNSGINLKYNQGTILVQESLSQRGLQLLEKPGDGQAYIVHNGKAWLGTTSTSISHPSEARPEDDAGEVLRGLLGKLLPGVEVRRTEKMFTGVRPLYDGSTEFGDGREVSRDFQIVEMPSGVYTVVGGKMTTARLMAEKTVDSIAQRLGNTEPCITDKVKLPEVK
ncbi:FAD-dependent oxidoreductase [Candidatus Woesearchaeota archaeon]|nr:FAD-dependent oxidoreductase [Candidatus Woesearchaeota archaeon]